MMGRAAYLYTVGFALPKFTSVVPTNPMNNNVKMSDIVNGFLFTGFNFYVS